MLAERLGRCDTGTGAKPSTLQLPQMSRQILRCKLIVFGLCSMQQAVHEDQRKAKRQKADSETDQHEESPNTFERHATPTALVPAHGAQSFGHLRLTPNTSSGDIQKRHSLVPCAPGAALI
jgi:hypothetical protein